MAGKRKSKTSSPIAEIASSHRITMLPLDGSNAKALKNKKVGQKITMQVTGEVSRMEKDPFSGEFGGSMKIKNMREFKKEKESVMPFDKKGGSSHNSSRRKTSRGKKIPRGAVKTDGFIKPKTRGQLAKLRKSKKKA